MEELMNFIDLGNYLESKGYDVVVERQSNGIYKCYVWHNEVCLGLGKIEYDTFYNARKTTLNNIYNKLNKYEK